MKEVIMRFSNVHPDVELCIKRNKKIIFKKLSFGIVLKLALLYNMEKGVYIWN